MIIYFLFLNDDIALGKQVLQGTRLDSILLTELTVRTKQTCSIEQQMFNKLTLISDKVNSRGRFASENDIIFSGGGGGEGDLMYK